jgi:hypothetical protein
LCGVRGCYLRRCVWGTGGREFKSRRSDQKSSNQTNILRASRAENAIPQERERNRTLGVLRDINPRSFPRSSSPFVLATSVGSPITDSIERRPHEHHQPQSGRIVSAAGRRARAVQSAAIIERLARLSPAAFFVHECQRLPLKIAIDRDLIALCKPAIERGLVTVADIKCALRFYATATGYLGACHEGAARVHLAGNVGRRRHRARRPRPQHSQGTAPPRRGGRRQSFHPAARRHSPAAT